MAIHDSDAFVFFGAAGGRTDKKILPALQGMIRLGGLILISLALCVSGCSIFPVLRPANDRSFSFGRDTLAFDNETEWKHPADARGGSPGPATQAPQDEYTLHCFVLSRSARQFFQFVRFNASRPRVDDDSYRQLIHQVISHDPSETAPQAERIVIPGYPNLHSFSIAKEAMLKEELGGASESFFQRGNWRMVFPFSHDHQEETANSMLAEIRLHRPPVVHLATFPNIKINHAVLLYSAAETDRGIRFLVYDPNSAARPASLTYDRVTRSFSFPPNQYFAGGEVVAYEVYRSAVY